MIKEGRINGLDFTSLLATSSRSGQLPTASHRT
jgi:hypothetical protein